MTATPTRALDRSDWLFLAAFAAVKLLLHLPVLDRYGYHHDELYFLACGHHLAFGYVDHAPLVPWIARLALPILSIDATERYVETLTFGAFENVYELTGDLRGMFGWPERVEAVADVWNDLAPEERERAVILSGSYGKAGAIDYFGGAYGLPKAASVNMTYHLWGLPEGPIDTLVAIGIPADELEKLYEEVTVARTIELENVNPWDRRFEVVVCRRPTVDLREIWAKNRRW